MFNFTDEFNLTIQEKPDLEELTSMWNDVFNTLPEEDNERLSLEEDQNFEDWFSVEAMEKYTEGKLIEVRTSSGELIGAAYVGKQNPITWIDGKKAELFIIGILSEFRGKGLGKKLVENAEQIAKEMGAEKIVVNTHVAMESDHAFYEKIGFLRMGILEHYYGNGSAIFFYKDLV